jgi:endoglucanase
MLFRGLSIADPDKLEEEGRWNRDIFAAAKDVGANLVRIPVHPAAWRSRTKEGYLKLLDQAVDWCTDLGIHVIIDWHSIGNLQTEMFQEPIYNTTKAETFDFWRTIAMHFHGNHTVAFYELFNEPTLYNGMLGTVTWPQWRQLNEEMIGIIRYWDKQTIPLVAGFDFAFASATYPMIATEIGFELKPGEVIDDNQYGNRITRFLEERGISWMAWVFDPSWGPRMLKSFDGFELAGDGEFFKQAMHRPPAVAPANPAN